MEKEKKMYDVVLEDDSHDNFLENVMKVNENTKERIDKVFEVRQEKEYIKIMIEDTDFCEFAGRWSIVTLLERVNAYTELPPNHKVAIHMQIAMLFNIDFVDMEDTSIRHAVLKRLLNKIEPLHNEK